MYGSNIDLLNKNNIKYKIYSHEDIATFDIGIKITDFDINKIVKTLSFEYNNNIIFISLLGKDKLDYKKLSNILKINRSSLKMTKHDKLEEIGFELGAIGPLIPNNSCLILFDKKIEQLDSIYLSIGIRSKTLEISPKDLQKITNAKYYDVTK